MAHTTVLLHESIDGLNLKQGSIFVDATLNAGGHSQLVLNQLDGNVRVIGIDIDADAIARAKQNIRTLSASFVISTKFWIKPESLKLTEFFLT